MISDSDFVVPIIPGGRRTSELGISVDGGAGELLSFKFLLCLPLFARGVTGGDLINGINNLEDPPSQSSSSPLSDPALDREFFIF